MKISKEIRVGFVAILAIALFIWGFNYLKGTLLFGTKKVIYTEYPFIGGLTNSSPVLVNGFKIGLVSDIYFKNNHSGNIIVELTITDKTIQIPNNSVANLISLDLLSSKGIGLSLGNSSVELLNGDTIPSHFEKSMLDGVNEQLLPMKQKVEKLMVSLDSTIVIMKTTLENFNTIFDDQNKRNLKMSLANLKTTLEKFEEVATSANSAIASARPMIKTYKELGDSLKELDIKTTLEKANKTFDNISLIMENINKGEGT
ncbi:MAG: hypothetical protein CO022_09855, partial [Flavobacteriales bacterium CG_4_9_14_0_2_um_filter_32_27]